jgi:3-oxoadipate enol-lactonase
VRLEVEGTEIEVDEYGDGPAVILIHGLGGTGIDLWKKIAAELARDFRVVTYDLRGSGRSDVTPGPYTIEQLAADLGGLVDGLRLDSVALVGHSLGGVIALEYAGTDPDRVRAVVGVGAVPGIAMERRELLRQRGETVARDGMAAVADSVAASGLAPSFRAAHPEEYQELVSLLASNQPAGYSAQCEALFTMTTSERLDRVKAPVLLVCGELDMASPPALNHENAARLPNAAVIEIPDCAHIIPWEKPDELLTAARPFLLDHGV